MKIFINVCFGLSFVMTLLTAYFMGKTDGIAEVVERRMEAKP